MNLKAELETLRGHLIDLKLFAIVFWSAILTFAFASACGLASFQAWSGLIATLAGISYLESRHTFWKYIEEMQEKCPELFS